MMAAFYAIYIVGRAYLRPAEAPAYDAKASNMLDRLWSFIRDLLPLGVIIFAVTGLIVIGVATPTEAAALGALSSVGLAACYGRLNIDLLKVALFDSMRITVMTFAIMAAAIGFSQILAFSGATRGLLGAVLGLKVAPILLIVGMQAIVMVLGCFMEQIAIMLITLPIFMPIVIALKFDPVWFAIVMLVNLETALMTPPFGLLLFVMKGVAPPGTSFGKIYLAAAPFVVINTIVMALLVIFPELVISALRFIG
jgi:tripartite ATP-independent transporter DctM subunit